MNLGASRDDGCTVVIQAFNKNRMMFLNDILEPYMASAFVETVVIKTNYTSEEVASHIGSSSHHTRGGRVNILQTHDMSLNSRFVIPQKFQRKCVIIADDDVSIEVQDLFLMYQVWEQNQDKLVGPFVRLISDDPNLSRKDFSSEKTLVYQDSSEAYNIVLTKLMFINKAYLDHYLSRCMTQIRKVVDELKNCEDIAINFSAALLSGLPLHVDISPSDLGDSRNSGNEYQSLVVNGIGAQKGHWETRQSCSNQIFKLLNVLPAVQNRSVMKFSGEHSLCWSGTRKIFCRNA